MSAPCTQVGYCISGHGFGHATRALAVMDALSRYLSVSFVILSSVPRWLFSQGLHCAYTYHPLCTDIGLVQQTAVQEDLVATQEALDSFYPLRTATIEQAASCLRDCAVVICDIAPLGIAVAEKLGVPSVLIENFTWDWIYRGYMVNHPGLVPHIDYLQHLFSQASLRIQATPVCCRRAGWPQVAPIARPLVAPEAVRRELKIDESQYCVLVTMGGFQGHQIAIPGAAERENWMFVFPESVRSREPEEAHLRFVGRECSHPDLVAASDLIVGKLGYSTVAEAYQGQTPFVYLERPDFRETAILADFVQQQMNCQYVEQKELTGPHWPRLVKELSWKRTQPEGEMPEGGAEQAARLIVDLLGEEGKGPHA